MPCKNISPKAKNIVKNIKNLRIVYRNSPLSFHKNAKKLAFLSNLCRIRFGFDKFHQYVMNTNNVDAVEVEISKDWNISTSEKQKVDEICMKDNALVEKLKISHTPTFILCTPEGNVIQIENLLQIQKLVKE